LTWQNPDVVVFLDRDHSERPSELPMILAPTIEGRTDITLGWRLGGAGNPARHRATNRSAIA